VTGLGDTHWLTLALGLVSLALVLGLRRLAPVVPGSLIAVLFGIVVVWALGLDDRGVDIVGHIDSGLSSLGLPEVAAADYLALAPSAIGVMLVGFAEGLGAAKAYAAQHHYEVDANRELLGLGAANLGAGLSSGMVVNGSLSKTAVNGSAGARSQVSGLVVAALTVLTLLFLTGLFETLPEATLAALGGVLVFDTLPGLFIGIAVSLLLLLYRASRPHVAVLGQVPGADGHYGDILRHPENPQAAGIVVLRLESGLFFANADAVRDVLRRTDGERLPLSAYPTVREAIAALTHRL
jgi:sulfate permease, SulP family